MKKNSIQFYIEQLKAADLLISTSGDTDGIVEYLTFDSRKVAAGTLFICKGAHFRAEYLEDSVKKGAICYVSETDYGIEGIGAIIVNDIRKAMPVLATVYYGDLTEKIKMVGITGTKGKSSTTFFVKGIIDEYQKSRNAKECAVCSGIFNNDGVIKSEALLTTPENLELWMHINNAVNSGMEYMVMEVSSQALKYDRVSNVMYEVGCLLNIGEDHISPIEHPDFEDYFGAKLRIFDQCRTAVVNLDADHITEILGRAEKAKRIVTFSQNTKDADVFAENITSCNAQVEFDISIMGRKEHIKMAALGLINVENALAAAAMCAAMDIPDKFIVKGLGKAVAPGRMEAYKSKDGKRMAIVDYAHNKMSYEKLFTSLINEFPGKEFIVVAGCVGDKAQNRRKELPEVMSKYAKKLIITDVSPGYEDPMDIAKEIAANMEVCGGKYEIELDRGLAIKRAFELADDNTIVIATGKAYEATMKRANKVVRITTDPENVQKYINMHLGE